MTTLKNWWRQRRSLLNLRVWRWHVQVWCWGARVFCAESGPSRLRLHELLFFRVQK